MQAVSLLPAVTTQRFLTTPDQAERKEHWNRLSKQQQRDFGYLAAVASDPLFAVREKAATGLNAFWVSLGSAKRAANEFSLLLHFPPIITPELRTPNNPTEERARLNVRLTLLRGLQRMYAGFDIAPYDFRIQFARELWGKGLEQSLRIDRHEIAHDLQQLWTDPKKLLQWVGGTPQVSPVEYSGSAEESLLLQLTRAAFCLRVLNADSAYEASPKSTTPLSSHSLALQLLATLTPQQRTCLQNYFTISERLFCRGIINSLLAVVEALYAESLMSAIHTKADPTSPNRDTLHALICSVRSFCGNFL